MLPTPEPTTAREAVKRDFYDLDTLIKDLNVPKEQIISSAPQQPGSTNQHNMGAAPEYDDQEPTEQLPDEVAALSGKMIAGTIDTSFSTAMGLYAHTSETEKYEASDKQLNKLNDAWAAVAKKYNYRMEDSPWFNVLALSAGVYIPKFQDAKNDRRFNEMDSRLKELQKLIQDNEARLNVVEKQNEAKK
jgi:hypothetical protein